MGHLLATNVSRWVFFHRHHIVLWLHTRVVTSHDSSHSFQNWKWLKLIWNDSSSFEMTRAHLKWLRLIWNDSGSFEMTRAHLKWLGLIWNDSSSFEMTQAHVKWLKFIFPLEITQWLENNSDSSHLNCREWMIRVNKISDSVQLCYTCSS